MTIPKRVRGADNVETEHTLEEFRGTLSVDFVAYWACYPGEKPVMYCRDGSGYPGCDPEAELQAIHVIAADGEYSHIDRSSADGIAFLDSLEPELYAIVERDADGRYAEHALEKANERYLD